jgi:hypothetical protein
LILNIDIADPRISLAFYGSGFEIGSPFTYHHDLANGNLVVILFLVSIIVVIIKASFHRIKGKKIPRITALGYLVSSFVAFILFSSVCVFTIRRARYLIVFFALLCPAICYLFQKCLGRVIQHSLITIIVFISVCEIISLSFYHCHQASYIGGRPEGYFGGHAMYEGTYQGTELLKQNEYKTLGIINDFVFEYPIWAMMKGYADRIEDVNVQNASYIHEDTTYSPDAVIQIKTEPIQGDSINVHGIEYRIINKFDDGFGYYALAENPDWAGTAKTE